MDIFSKSKDKHCPFHQQTVTKPENYIQAFCDQLHSDVCHIFSMSFISDKSKRIAEASNMLAILKIHVKTLEDKLEGDKHE